MKFWVSFRPDALRDLEHALNYFGSYGEKTESRFMLELNDCVEQIRIFPESHQKIYKQVRRALLQKYVYALYYIVHLEQETIEIVALMDARRDPQRWQSRL